MTSLKLTDIPGIGPATARSLADHGFPSVDSVAAATVQALSGVPGFAPTRSATTIAAAQQLALEPAEHDIAPATSEDAQDPEKKKEKKRKKKKKKKKKRKKNDRGGKKDKKTKKKEDGKKKRKT